MKPVIRKFRMLFILLALTPLLLLTGVAPDAGAATIRVPVHQPTIQAGIDVAQDGDTVLVADGTWTGEGNHDLDFGGKAITVRSQNGPQNCIIDSEEEGRGFYLHSGEGRTSAIRGFTITGCGIYNDTTYTWSAGGGILCEGASPVIEGNLILENKGNGVACNNDAEPLITGNTIAGNEPRIGAGIWCNHASPVISNNYIHSNEMTDLDPGLGGGIACFSSSAVIAGNEIAGNLAEGYTIEFPGRGGGIFCADFDGRIEDNLIHDNEAHGMGGGIFLSDSSPLVRNNLILDNLAGGDGGGIGIEHQSTPVLVGNTISGNSVSPPYGSGGGLYITTNWTDPAPLVGVDVYRVVASDCIITGNTAPTGPQITVHSFDVHVIAELDISYSDVEGGEDGVAVQGAAMLSWGSGMIDTDPLFFTGPDGGHYLSQIAAGQGADSPCVDAGDPAGSLSRGTTRTDLVNDDGPNDMGYHYASPQLLVTGPGPGYDNPPDVRLFFPQQEAAPMVSFTAYGALRYGVNVTCGDVTGNGYDDLITGAGPGPIYGPHVRGFDGTGVQLPGLSFLAYNTHRWGVNVACGELDGDGYDELVTGPGPGPVSGPHVRIWDYDNSGIVTPWTTGSWFGYATPRWGINVACGDLDGDGYDEIVTGAGPGAIFGPHVRGWNVDGGPVTPMPGVSFMAYGTFHYGVKVTCGDLDADGIDEIVTAPGPSPVFGSHVRGWNVDGGTVSPMMEANFFAWPPGEATYGANVYAGADLDGDGRDELVVGGGPDPNIGCPVKVFNFDSGSPMLWFSLEAYPGLTRGTTVSGGAIQP